MNYLRHVLGLCVVVLMGSGCGPTESAGAFSVVVSGEGAAQAGYPYPPQDDGPSFSDGWQLTYTSVIVAIDTVTIAENPDLNKGDQSQTGPVVAQLNGPWVVDLVKPGPVTAQEGNGTAWSLGTIANQNKKGNVPFDATQKYAFGYSMVKASAGATNVNGVDATRLATMVSRGYSVLVSGTAEFKGQNCRSTDASYDFARLPKKVNFEFGYAAPTDFKNCVNPLLMPMESRGIQGKKGSDTTAQITLHLDHPFWEALKEDSPLRFDLIAAQKSAAVGSMGAAEASLSLSDLTSISFVAGKDAQGLALPWRTCGTVQPGERTSGVVSYDPAGVAVSATGGAAGLKGLADYMTFNLSTFGHLNNDGLCVPLRQFDSPAQP